YGIYEVERPGVDVYHLTDHGYERMPPNARGRFPIPPLGAELGIWHGRYQDVELPWMRFYDAQGQPLLAGDEQAEVERQRAEAERQRAEAERQRAEQEHQSAEEARRKVERLAAKLRVLGVDPEEL